jgi:TatD DNase family protein
VEELIAEARSAGVDQMVTIGIDVASSRRSKEIADKHDVLFSVGVHPNSAAEWNSGASEVLQSLLEGPRAVAVGETGLDFYRDSCPPDVQRAAFRDHIELARAADVALVVHTRESVSAALDELESATPPARVVFHCWSGSAVDLRRALDLGAYISFAGNISFKSADDLRAMAPLVPRDRLLVETDSPFLAPVPHRGRSNRPAYVADVGVAIAAAIGTDATEIASTTAGNAFTLFSR